MKADFQQSRHLDNHVRVEDHQCGTDSNLQDTRVSVLKLDRVGKGIFFSLRKTKNRNNQRNGGFLANEMFYQMFLMRWFVKKCAVSIRKCYFHVLIFSLKTQKLLDLDHYTLVCVTLYVVDVVAFTRVCILKSYRQSSWNNLRGRSNQSFLFVCKLFIL